MFSIIQTLLLQKISLYIQLYLGVGFEFGPQRSSLRVSVVHEIIHVLDRAHNFLKSLKSLGLGYSMMKNKEIV